MKRNLLFIILLLLLPGLHQVFAASTIKKVAPTFWWAGMKNPELQILLYGAAYHPQTSVFLPIISRCKKW